jgi:hypothetical protein
MTTPKEKAPSTRKPNQRKVATKEAELEKDVEVVEVAKAPEIQPTKRAKRVEIDRNEMIECRSATNGKLIYVSNRTSEKYLWDDFNAVVFIDMGELLTMKSSQPAFFNDVLIVLDDEDAVEYLGLKKLYETVFKLDDLDAFFDQPINELAEILPKLPKGLQKTVSTRARKLVENGRLDSLSKIKLIEEKLGVDLQLFMK